MMDERESLSQMTRYTLDAYREEYRELIDVWRHLDTKAQGITAIAGVFLAGVLAWARDLPDTFGVLERGLLALAALCLTASVVVALLSLEAHSFNGPPLGRAVDEERQAVIEKLLPGEHVERLDNLLNDLLAGWGNTIDEVHEVAARKGRLVRWGQRALVVAPIAVAAIVLTRVFSGE
jgi:hypothetical protein